MEETHDGLIKDYIKSIKEYVKENGGIFPHINVFAKNIAEDKKGCIVIPLPGNIFESEENKDEFIDSMIPQIAKKIKEDFLIYGVAWTYEAWIRKENADEKMPDNWKKLPITGEVLLLSMQFHNRKELYTFNIIRNGKQVNEEGELIDSVELEESDVQGSDFKGKLSTLYEKFVKD